MTTTGNNRITLFRKKETNEKFARIGQGVGRNSTGANAVAYFNIDRMAEK